MAKRQDDLAPRLHSVAIRLLRRLRAEDRHAGLSPARLSALSVLVYGGPQTASSLAEAEQLRLPTISRLLSGMEKDGLIRRKADDNDARVSWFHPTAKGKRLLEKARAYRLARLDALLADIAPEDRNVLGAAVTILEHVLGKRLAGK